MTRRITHPALFLACVLLGVTQLDVASQSKYGAKVVTVKAAALAMARTYQWATDRKGSGDVRSNRERGSGCDIRQIPDAVEALTDAR